MTPKSIRTLAIKALANKLSKATYFIMGDQVPFDPEKLFHSLFRVRQRTESGSGNKPSGLIGICRPHPNMSLMITGLFAHASSAA